MRQPPRMARTVLGLPIGIWMLMGVHAAIAGWYATITRLHTSDFQSAVFLACFFAQASLLGMSVALPTISLRSVGGAAVGLAGLQFLALKLTAGHFDGQFLILGVLVVAALMVVVGVILRARHFRLHCVFAENAPPPQPWRFSRAQLLIMTSGAALVAASANWMRSLEFNTQFIPLIVIVSLAFGPGSLLALWAALGRGVVVRRGTLALAVSILPGIGLYALLPPHQPIGFWTFITFAQAAVTFLSLVVVRSCGYRLVRTMSPEPRHVQQLELVE